MADRTTTYLQNLIWGADEKVRYYQNCTLSAAVAVASCRSSENPVPFISNTFGFRAVSALPFLLNTSLFDPRRARRFQSSIFPL